jgi:hypothetical protein
MQTHNLRRRWGWLTAAVLAAGFFGQAAPEPEIRIVIPYVDRAAGKVSVRGAFWNNHVADWIEVAICGRPSDFLHETLLSVTTTRTMMEGAMRDIGMHDGDAWADSVKDFPRVRGDRFMVLLEFTMPEADPTVTPWDTRNVDAGKRVIYSLDELMEFEAWGVALGPFGFEFRGDPDRAPKTSAERMATNSLRAGAGTQTGESDATKILRDDPEIAIQFKGLQHTSQSYADHPLAYDNWEYETINWARNFRRLSPDIYGSNGKIPVTMTLLKVNEEQLLTESANVWHDNACRQYILKQIPTAQAIDKEKAEYWKLRDDSAALRKISPELRDAEKELHVFGRLAVLAAEIEKNYAALDAAWTTWATDHLDLETNDETLVPRLKDQANRWREHMLLEQERTAQLAIAEQAAFDQKEIALKGADAGTPQEIAAKRQTLSGKEMEARSRALQADNKQSYERWHAEEARLDPKTDPREIWIKDVHLHVELTAARQKTAAAGITYGAALQKETDASALKKLGDTYTAAVTEATLDEQRLALADVEFEIEKREGFGNDPDLPGLKKQQDQIKQRIDQLQKTLSATTAPAGATSGSGQP